MTGFEWRFSDSTNYLHWLGTYVNVVTSAEHFSKVTEVKSWIQSERRPELPSPGQKSAIAQEIRNKGRRRHNPEESGDELSTLIRVLVDRDRSSLATRASNTAQRNALPKSYYSNPPNYLTTRHSGDLLLVNRWQRSVMKARVQPTARWGGD